MHTTFWFPLDPAYWVVLLTLGWVFPTQGLFHTSIISVKHFCRLTEWSLTTLIVSQSNC